jgi:hypothetical protein
MNITLNMLRYALRTKDPVYGYWFFQFYYEAFAEPLQTLSKKFLPETDAAIDELLSFQVEV